MTYLRVRDESQIVHVKCLVQSLPTLSKHLINADYFCYYY